MDVSGKVHVQMCNELPNFHLVVTCVKRKNEICPKVRLADKVRRGSIDSIYEKWANRLTSSESTSRAMELYQGAAWSAAKCAYEEIDRERFTPHLWVVSCGYGLIRADDNITNYGLTFKVGQDDSLCSTSAEFDELVPLWWEKLTVSPPIGCQKPFGLRVLINGMSPQDTLLMAAGPEYYEAVAGDLFAAQRDIIERQCWFVGEPVVHDGATKAMQGRFLGTAGRGDFLMNRLGGELHGCNRTQIPNRSAQYLIRHYANKEKASYRLPSG